MNTVKVGDRIIVPSKVVCIGRNYVEHIAELNNEMPDEMVVFMKPNSAITEVLQSSVGEQLDYESEICFICEGGRFTAAAFGLDLTKRKLQAKLKAKGLPWERSKAFDGAALFSRFVRIPDETAELSLTLHVNGKPAQSGGTGLMIHKPGQILAELKSFMSLEDGDIVMTGTPKGVSLINPGDRLSGALLLDGKVVSEAEWVAR